MRDLPLPTLPFFDLRPARPVAPLRPRAPQAVPPSAGLAIAWARSEDEVREAQALRYRVFVEEMGARPNVAPDTPAGLDVDRFDAFCEHLLVRSRDAAGRAGAVIGTYRVLTPAAARRAGGLYSETEFDLAPLRALRPRLVELGRSCIDAEHRSGGAILALWGALAEFMHRNGLDAMIGCASVTMSDGGHYAASLWRRLEATSLAAPERRVRPLLPLPVEELRQDLTAETPALIKGYLRCGARILGAPAWDPDFGTADLPMLMQLADLPERYRRHFLG